MEQDLANLTNVTHGSEDTRIVEAAYHIIGSARVFGYQAIGGTARRIEHVAQGIGPYQQRAEDMQSALTCLHALANEFRRWVSDCPWSDAAAAS